MKQSRRIGLVVLLGWMFVITLGFAQSESAAPSDDQASGNSQGDVQAGKQMFYTCMGCHGIQGYNNVYPTFHVPKLGGQHAAYIVSALEEYRKKKRDHSTMHAQASSLSDEDIQNIAAYLSQQKSQ